MPMGVTIHYKGTVNKSRVAEITSLIKDFAEAAGWDYRLVDQEVGPIQSGYVYPSEIYDPFGRGVTRENRAVFDVRERIYGIKLDLNEHCDTFFLVWNMSRCSDRAYLAMYIPSRDGVWYEDTCLVKTQFAPVWCHTTICKLLHLLADRFGAYLDVCDEGEYYESGDPERLARYLSWDPGDVGEPAFHPKTMGVAFIVYLGPGGDIE